MRKQGKALPKYRKHKATGRALVTLNGRDIYLGPHGTKASKIEYDRLIAEWLANGRRHDDIVQITVSELISAYWKFAQGYYVKNGKRTGELAGVKVAMRHLRTLWGNIPANEFGPKSLVAVRQLMVDAGNSRGYTNQQIGRIKRCFRWGVAQEMLDVTVYQALCAVDGLKKGKCKAREPDPILPVCETVVNKTLPFLIPVVADMIRFQSLTGCRPGELFSMRPCDIATDRAVWEYRPSSHKMEHHNRQRVILIGPKAQEILKPYLNNEIKRPCFRRRKRFPWSRFAYGKRIHKACEKASVEKWAPNQLRHLAATKIRSQFGLEAAQVILGHSRADITQIYAEKDLRAAAEIARKVG